MKVMKFGGAALAVAGIGGAEKIVRAEERQEPVVLVVSALRGVTDLLLLSAEYAEVRDTRLKSALREIRAIHRDAIERIPQKASVEDYLLRVEQLFDELEQTLNGIRLLKEKSSRSLDLVASFGERLSALVVAAHFSTSRRAVAVDARDFIVTDDRFTYARVDIDGSKPKIVSHFRKLRSGSRFRATPIVTGFIGATADGRTTTLGRNGSDYTATIIGAALSASSIEIWKEIPGIMSADPTAVPTSFVLPELSYEEAMELSFFGTKALQAECIAPVIGKGIPILIKGVNDIAAPGTRITSRSLVHGRVAKGISSLDNVALLELRGPTMIGVSGIARRLFETLDRYDVGAILISQASSEQTICLAVQRDLATVASRALSKEFRAEFQTRVMNLDVRPNQAVVAVVGEGMRGIPGVAGNIFRTLGRNNVNVSAIAQGGSERNISLVVDSADRIRALNVIHESFFEERKRVAIVALGVGNVGAAVLDRLGQQRKALLQKGFDVRVCAIANSKRYLFDRNGIDLSTWRQKLAGSNHDSRIGEIVARLHAETFTHVVLVDCTASGKVVSHYPDFIRANAHIVTPNKKANVLPWKQYEALLELLQSRDKHFLFEANVGAGLPVISTLQDLIHSGDRVEKIEGIFSGTLSYLFNGYDGTKPFSEVIRNAHRLGLTEPDPRDDLSGIDVARKLLILARMMGFKMNLSDIRVQSLVSDKLWKSSSPQEFLAQCGALDGPIHRRFEQARRAGTALKYVGRFERGKASAGLCELPLSHPLASTKGTDNVIAFSTDRYKTTPLVIQGPGAGAEVTASGVFSDLLKLFHYLPL